MRKKMKHIYSKSILILRKDRSLLNVTNKNVFTIILSFLKTSEIKVLFGCGRTMRSLVEIILQNRITSFKI